MGLNNLSLRSSRLTAVCLAMVMLVVALTSCSANQEDDVASTGRPVDSSTTDFSTTDSATIDPGNPMDLPPKEVAEVKDVINSALDAYNSGNYNRLLSLSTGTFLSDFKKIQEDGLKRELAEYRKTRGDESSRRIVVGDIKDNVALAVVTVKYTLIKSEFITSISLKKIENQWKISEGDSLGAAE